VDARDRAEQALTERELGAHREWPRSVGHAQSAQVPVRLAAIVQPRDRLLSDVAALRERHGALVEPGLLGDHGVVEVDAVARTAVLDPQRLGRRLGHGRGAGGLERGAYALGRVGLAEDVDPGVGPDRADSDAADLGRDVRMLLRAEHGSTPAIAADCGPISDSNPDCSVRLCSSTS